MDLEFYLKCTKSNIDKLYFVDKLHFVNNVFEAGKWLSIPDNIVGILKKARDEDDEKAYFLLNIRERALEHLKYFPNINNLEDILVLKKLLQNEYINNKALTTMQKQHILSILSTKFMTVEDEVFFKTILNHIFQTENVYLLSDSMCNIFDALKYIENIKTFTVDEIKIIKNSDNQIKKIYYKNNNLYSNTSTSLSALKVLKYIDSKEIIFLKNYKIYNPLFCSFSGVELKTEIIFSMEKNHINLEMLCLDESIFKLNSIEYIKFGINVFKMLKEYRSREQMFLDKQYNHKNFTYDIKSKSSNILFSFIWSKRHCDYYVMIDKNKKLKFDAVEFINLFQKIFFFLTVYYKMKYNICLKDKLNISNRDFLMLIGIKYY